MEKVFSTSPDCTSGCSNLSISRTREEVKSRLTPSGAEMRRMASERSSVGVSSWRMVVDITAAVAANSTATRTTIIGAARQACSMRL